MVVVKKQVKELSDFLVSKEVYAKLEEKVITLIREAEERARANGRKTLRACDL